VRILKLIIWDLDETLLTGILEEGDKDINPVASKMLRQLDDRGILQAIATQSPPDLVSSAVENFGWSDLFVQVEAHLGSKARKVRHILDSLGINLLDTAFVDEDPFERDQLSVQIRNITTWSIAELETYLAGTDSQVTKEAQRRPQIYREQQARARDEEAVGELDDFLRSCNIQITIRPCIAEDAMRAEELLTRTHHMNLGVLPIDEAIARLNRPDEHHVIIAEMKDVYGDMGRCGIIHLSPVENSEAVIESLAISCRTRARGLSLGMLMGLIRHPDVRFKKYCCRYIFNGSNRPLRMLLMGAGFKPVANTDELVLYADRLENVELPDWIHINYLTAPEKVV